MTRTAEGFLGIEAGEGEHRNVVGAEVDEHRKEVHWA